MIVKFYKTIKKTFFFYVPGNSFNNLVFTKNQNENVKCMSIVYKMLLFCVFNNQTLFHAIILNYEKKPSP